jgi:hypothetical protein
MTVFSVGSPDQAIARWTAGTDASTATVRQTSATEAAPLTIPIFRRKATADINQLPSEHYSPSKASRLIYCARLEKGGTPLLLTTEGNITTIDSQ